MHKSFVLISFLIGITTISFSQVPRFQRTNIGGSGCALYTPGVMEFDSTFSEDSSMVYTGDVEVDSFTFFVICIRFKEQIGNDKAANADLLKNYLDFLQHNFEIIESAGYGEGHTLEANPNATGVIDYWLDTTATSWAIKGWIDNGYMAVLGVFGPGDYPIFNVQDMYLNGFRFPE